MSGYNHEFTSRKHLLQLFEKGLRLEVLWDVVVQSCDYLVDLLFPRWINVFSGGDRLKEFFEGLFNDPSEAVGHLQNMDLGTFDTFVTEKVCIRNLSLGKFSKRNRGFLMQSGCGAEYWSRGDCRVIDILGRDVILQQRQRGAGHQIRKWPLAERNKPDLCRYCHCFMINQGRHTALCPG